MIQWRKSSHSGDISNDACAEVTGVRNGLVPGAYVHHYESTDRLRCRRELQRARSLLFVAATRARDSLLITWHGTTSPFLPESSKA